MQNTNIYLAFLITFFAIVNVNGSIVFQDDFSNNGGLNGSTPDVGGNWSGADYNVVSGAVDLTTDSDDDIPVVAASANFTTALGAGETLIVSVEVSEIIGNGNGVFGGLSLFTGPGATGEEVLLGQLFGEGQWGIDASSDGGALPTGAVQTGGDSSGGTISFTYDFDTGNYVYTSPNGIVIDSTLNANEPIGDRATFQSVRIADNGASHTIGGVTVSIVPEPSSLVLFVGVSFLCFLTRRRRKV